MAFERYGALTSPARFPPGSPVEAIWEAGKFCLTGYVGRHSTPSLRWPHDLRDEVSLGPSTRLRIAMFDELEHNALAFREGATYVVALYHGLVVTIPEFALRLWADPAVAPWIGDVSRLQPPPNSTPLPAGLEALEVERLLAVGDLAAAQRVFEASRGLDRPALVERMGPVRQAAMQRCIEDAFRYVWLHEIAHVVWGHLDLVGDAAGLAHLTEVAGPVSAAYPPALSQFTEMQADQFAIAALLDYRAMDLAGGHAGSTDPIRETDAPAIAAMACVMVQLIFAMALEVGGRADTAGSHPPVWLRTYSLLSLAEQKWRELGEVGQGRGDGELGALAKDRADRTIASMLGAHPALMAAFNRMGAETEAADGESKQAYAERFGQTAAQWDAVVRPRFKFRREGGGLALSD